MPGADRNIRKSLMAHLRGMFQSPPAGSGLSPFGVYNEDDLIAYNNKAPLPNRPFVYLLDSYMRPKAPALPEIIVEVPLIRQLPYELGNRSGRTTSVMIHCFGRARGERDDVSSFITDYFGSTFPVYKYTSGSSGDTAVFLENAEIDPTGVVLEEWNRSITPDLRREGTVDLWMVIHMIFRTRSIVT